MTILVRFNELGEPGVLRLEEVPTPQPAADEVRLRVQAIGLNQADMLWRTGNYIEDPQLPSGLGNEAAGVVEEVGSAVTGLSVGDRVACLPGAHQGRYPTYGDHIIFPASHLVRYPERLSPEEAAAAYMAFLTGYFPIFEMARLQPGDSLLVAGASSGTGLAALQMAARSGLRAIATTRSRAKRDALLATGASDVVVLDEGEPLSEVRRLTDGRGVSLVYDGVGGPWLTGWGEVVARHGWYVLYGLSGGTELRYPALAQLRRGWRFHLYMVLEFTGSPSMGLPRNDEALRRGLRYLNDGLSDGGLRVHIDRLFALREVVDAHHYLARGQHVGKVVMTV